MKVYLAGPMRNIPEFNFPAFLETADLLRRCGHVVFNPAERDIIDAGFEWHGLDGTLDELKALGFDLRAALAADLAWITEHAEAVVVLDGWEKSSGAQAEVATAGALGLPVFRADEHGTLLALGEPAGEVRITNEETGGEKGTKPARFDLIPGDVLWGLAELYGRGAAKYEARNWERGYDWSLSFAALNRHAWAFWNGETFDPETGCHHMLAVMFHAAALVRFTTAHPELDNRPPQPEGASCSS